MAAILAGFQAIFSDPMAIVLLFFGVFFGIVFGCIPGLTATLGVALMIPFTYTMSSTQGLSLLIAIYVGGISGGLITATLINIPGTPSSIFTTFDGYPMASSGRPREALSLGVFVSWLGGTFSAIALFTIAPQLAKVALIFGNWEYFAVSLMGLCVVISMASNDLLTGLIGAVVGILAGAVGIDSVTGAQKLTFGSWQLINGIQSTALMMGLFAIREIMIQSKDIGVKPRMKMDFKGASFLPPFDMLKQSVKPIIMGCLIGTGIGILPGIGQNAATLITYNQAKRISKHPEQFGHGSPEGICASETSNNAVNGGALIPLVTLGIPGDLTTSALIGGLMIQGLQPGPMLFEQHIDVVGAVMVAYFLSNFIMYVMELGLMRVFIKAVSVKFSILFPAILMFCVLGVFALNNRVFDLWILLITGVVSYALDQLGVDMTPVILGFILGPLIDFYYHRAMIGANANFGEIFTRPIATVAFIIAILFLVVPIFNKNIRAKKNALNV